jgi:hypothetical protein
MAIAMKMAMSKIKFQFPNPKLFPRTQPKSLNLKLFNLKPPTQNP